MNLFSLLNSSDVEFVICVLLKLKMEAPSIFFWNITLLEVYRVLGLEYPEKTTDKLYHIWAWFELTFMVIGTDCTSSYKSNYHTITTIMTQLLDDSKKGTEINHIREITDQMWKLAFNHKGWKGQQLQRTYFLC